jgi:hypothetical protein
VFYFIFWGCGLFEQPSCQAGLEGGVDLPDIIFESAEPIERNFRFEIAKAFVEPRGQIFVFSDIFLKNQNQSLNGERVVVVVQVDGAAETMESSVSFTAGGDPGLNVEIFIPTENFDCGEESCTADATFTITPDEAYGAALPLVHTIHGDAFQQPCEVDVPLFRVESLD